MGKTTKYLLLGGGVLLAAYVIFSRPSTVGGTGVVGKTGWAGILDGVGHAGTGLGSLWGSIFSSSSSSAAPVDTSISDSGVGV